MVFASRSNLCFLCGSADISFGKILTATSRPSRVSLARYTSLIPPAPSGPTISYGPSFVPEARSMLARDYTARKPLRGNSSRVPGRMTGNSPETQPCLWLLVPHSSPPPPSPPIATVLAAGIYINDPKISPDGTAVAYDDD